jgi:hypothetical protein
MILADECLWSYFHSRDVGIAIQHVDELIRRDFDGSTLLLSHLEKINLIVNES